MTIAWNAVMQFLQNQQDLPPHPYKSDVPMKLGTVARTPNMMLAHAAASSEFMHKDDMTHLLRTPLIL